MPLRTERGRFARQACNARWSLLLCALTICSPPALAAEPALPTEAQIETALEQVKADPNLSTERKMRTLKWARESESKPPRSSNWAWIRDLFVWIGATGRVVFWLAIALLVAVLAVFLARYARRLDTALPRRAPPPTHVRDLDIRPESLPDDIGGTALALWEDGQHRAALALLYRGLLSRLVHAYNVGIKQSSTESECLELARPQLQMHQVEYVTRLLGVWQQAIYGGREPQLADVQALCASFTATLSPASAAGRYAA